MIDVVQRHIGESRARCSGAGASRDGVASLVEIHIRVLRSNRPRTLQRVFDTKASPKAARVKILAPGEARGSRGVSESRGTMV